MPSFARKDDSALLRAARRDSEAFAAFYDRHEAPLMGFAMRLTRDAELAADVTGEVFATLLEQIGIIHVRPDATGAQAYGPGIDSATRVLKSDGRVDRLDVVDVPF